MTLTEADYLDIVENIQKAMMIEPFRPSMADVVALIGAWRLQQHENERLRAALRNLLGYTVKTNVYTDRSPTIHEAEDALGDAY